MVSRLRQRGSMPITAFFLLFWHVRARTHTQGDILFTLPGYSEEESSHIYQQLLYLLCSPGHIGTMFQATSTNDITFWVLHPSVDRCASDDERRSSWWWCR